MRTKIRYLVKVLLIRAINIFFQKFSKARQIFFKSFVFIDPNKLHDYAKLIYSFEPKIQEQMIQNISGSQSQFGQDLFALAMNGFKSDGFFVEFGATDGVELSNTFLLEKKYHWTGILAEPAKIWQRELRRNRNVAVENRCVYGTSGIKLQFIETKKASALSGIREHLDRPTLGGRSYVVESVSLEDMLVNYHAPSVIDFLSIDTEGSEFEILNSFNFSLYQFRVIVIEHNFRDDKDEIREILLKNGYKQVLENVSGIEFWFINPNLLESPMILTK